MKKIIYPLIISVLFLSFSCRDKNNKEEEIDKNALLLGNWKLVETNDPAGVPPSLIYTFAENGIFTYTITTKVGSRGGSVLDGTWKFLDNQQTQLEIVILTPSIYIIESLTESTLRITKDDISMVMVKQ